MSDKYNGVSVILTNAVKEACERIFEANIKFGERNLVESLDKEIILLYKSEVIHFQGRLDLAISVVKDVKLSKAQLKTMRTELSKYSHFHEVSSLLNDLDY